MKLLRYLLLPFAGIYFLITAIRNKLYDWKLLKSTSFDFPVIGIGNLSTGGTGKTPMSEYVLDLLIKNGYKPALLSRGYSRSSKGYYELDEKTPASLAGDEPVQIKHKFPEAVVAVSESRVEGIKKLKASHPEINVVVLDDCFQHRQLKAGFYILLTTYSKPYYNDIILPTGNLRESAAGRKRADVIIMTKTPELTQEEKDELKDKLKPCKHQEVFFSEIEYGRLLGVHLPSLNTIPTSLFQNYHMHLFTGIANPLPLKAFLNDKVAGLTSVTFPDHHVYRQSDIDKIVKQWQGISHPNKIMVTTEKDWSRLYGTSLGEELARFPLYYLPVKTILNSRGKAIFDAKLLEYVRTGQKIG